MSDLEPKFKVGDLVCDRRNFLHMRLEILRIVGEPRMDSFAGRPLEKTFWYPVKQFRYEKGKNFVETEYSKQTGSYDLAECQLANFQEEIDANIQELEDYRVGLLKFNDAVFELQNHKEEINGK